MAEPVPAAAPPKKRGPKTPEGKVRSRMNALRHGLRAREFGLLPGEDPAEWAAHLSDLRAALGPRDAYEGKLVTALAAAMWKEARADRQEAEVLAAIPPTGPGRPCGGDLQEPRHALSLNTAVRYGTAAGMATQRAQRAFLQHRKATAQGLVLPAAEALPGAADAGRADASPPSDPAVQEVPPDAANRNCTNELADPVRPTAGRTGHVVAPAPPRAAPGKPAKAAADPYLPEDELDDAAWLASLPVVEPDPGREAERRRALMKVEPASVRRTIGHAPLRGVELYLVSGDMAAYEQWFARQPKPPRRVMDFLTDEDAAAVRWVTRDNPPWIRGKYLGYHRPPVPAHLFEPGAAGEDDPPERPASLPAPAEAAPEPTAAPAATLAGLEARLARLLDRGQPRLADELDLAEAVCALKWPNWPRYTGPVDPSLLRRALADVAIDTATLHWLGSNELARACQEAITRTEGS